MKKNSGHHIVLVVVIIMTAASATAAAPASRRDAGFIFGFTNPTIVVGTTQTEPVASPTVERPPVPAERPVPQPGTTVPPPGSPAPPAPETDKKVPDQQGENAGEGTPASTGGTVGITSPAGASQDPSPTDNTAAAALMETPKPKDTEEDAQGVAPVTSQVAASPALENAGGGGSIKWIVALGTLMVLGSALFVGYTLRRRRDGGPRLFGRSKWRLGPSRKGASGGVIAYPLADPHRHSGAFSDRNYRAAVARLFNT